MNADRDTQFRSAAAFVADWRRPLLISHAKPDGDALGALAAMRIALGSSPVQAMPLLFDPIPGRYRLFERYDAMPIWGRDVREEDLAACDGIILLDTCTYSQLDPIADWLRTSKLPKLAVDHHVTREPVADEYLVDESAAATCLILYEWFCAMDRSIEKGTAEALFVGIAMDTGWFRHSNTNARVLAAAADLARAGAEPHRIHDSLFQRESPPRVRLLGAAIDTMELFSGDRAAVMDLSASAMRAAGAGPGDTEDIVNEPLRIESVVVSALLVEPDDDGPIRVSLRSKAPSEKAEDRSGRAAVPDIDVAELARSLGGGGHRRAAGVRIDGTLQDVRRKIVDRIKALIPR